MILIVSPSPRTAACIPLLEGSTGMRVQASNSVRDAVKRLRNAAYELVILDESYIETLPQAEDSILAHAEAAATLCINLAVSSAQRVAREAKAALRRARADRDRAMKWCSTAVRAQIGSELTGILLGVELALCETGVSPTVRARLDGVLKLARQVSAAVQAPAACSKVAGA